MVVLAALWGGGAALLVLSAALILLVVIPRIDSGSETVELVDLPGPTPQSAVDSDEIPTARLASDTAVGDPLGAGELSDDPDGWRGVAASPDRYGVVALWDERRLWVSRDDGVSFHQALAHAQPLGAVAVAPDGRVWAARQGGWLGQLTPAGTTRWQRLALDQVLAIDAHGSWLAVLGLSADRADGFSALLWLSPDHGRTWRRQVMPAHGDAGNQVRVERDGTIDLLIQDSGLDERLHHLRGHVDGRPVVEVWSGQAPEPSGLAHDGSNLVLGGTVSARAEGALYLERCAPPHPAGGASAAPSPASARRPTRARCGQPLLLGGSHPTPLTAHDWNVVIGTSATRTFAVVDHTLLELAGPLAQRVSPATPGPIGHLTVDGIGRAVAVVGRTAARFSPRHGWRRLFDLPRP